VTNTPLATDGLILIDPTHIPDEVNGIPVIAKVPLPQHTYGELPIAVVICRDLDQRTSGVSWVTWYWVLNPDGTGYATEGGYHPSYADALSDLADRARRYSETSSGKRF
jgi:hypothetical protein